MIVFEIKLMVIVIEIFYGVILLLRFWIIEEDGRYREFFYSFRSFKENIWCVIKEVSGV